MNQSFIKIMSLLSIILSLLLISCKSEKFESETNRMYFIVSEISDDNEFQTLGLIDLDGYSFLTHISKPSTLNIEVGDSISLIANQILESYPSKIESKDIRIEDKSKEKYQKIISEIYWIKSRSLVDDNNHYFYQNNDKLDTSAKWYEINNDIEYFIAKPGEYHKIKVLKKFKNDNSIDFELISVLKRIEDENFIALINTNISTDKEVYELGSPIILTTTINNNSNKSYSFLPFGTPFEDTLTNDCLNITYNEEVIDYRGILVSRMPPSTDDYIEINPVSSISNSIDISNDYIFDKKGDYKIQFKDKFDGPSESNIIKISII